MIRKRRILRFRENLMPIDIDAEADIYDIGKRKLVDEMYNVAEMLGTIYRADECDERHGEPDDATIVYFGPETLWVAVQHLLVNREQQKRKEAADVAV